MGCARGVTLAHAVEDIQVGDREHAGQQGIADHKHGHDDDALFFTDPAFGDDIQHPSSTTKLIAHDGDIGDDGGDSGQDTGPVVVAGLQNVRYRELSETPDPPGDEVNDDESQPAAAATYE